MAISRLQVACASLVLAVTAPALADTVVGPESAPGRYNRLRDMAVREAPVVGPASPDVFGTAAVNAGVTFYDARFRRVSRTDRDHPLVLQLASRLRGMSPEAQLAAVQREVLQRVRFGRDLDIMRVSDFWANAGETLERGAGDDEDIAIVEMQVLKAAGFDPRDLYISIGRAPKVGAHAVLLARTPSGFMVLDDRIGHPVAARDSRQFVPVLTVGYGKSWIHGHRVRGMTAHASAQ